MVNRSPPGYLAFPCADQHELRSFGRVASRVSNIGEPSRGGAEPEGSRLMPFIRREDLCPGIGPWITRPPRGHRIIYVLLDPRDDTVRYIGVTKLDILKRLDSHIEHPSNRFAAEWFESLSSIGMRPNIEPIEIVSDALWEKRERYWIASARQLRATLLNISPGGRGNKRRHKNIDPNKLHHASKSGPVVYFDAERVQREYGVPLIRKPVNQISYPQSPAAPKEQLSPMRQRIRAYIRRHGI